MHYIETRFMYSILQKWIYNALRKPEARTQFKHRGPQLPQQSL